MLSRRIVSDVVSPWHIELRLRTRGPDDYRLLGSLVKGIDRWYFLSPSGLLAVDSGGLPRPFVSEEHFRATLDRAELRKRA